MGCSVSSSAVVTPATHSLAAKYQLASALDEGAFGQVHKAARRGSADFVHAVRFVDASLPEAREQALKEKGMWWMAGAHKNVLMLQDVCQHSIHGVPCIAFVSERCQGSLATDALQGICCDASLTLSLLSEMCCSLQYLHSVNIMHRNIQPASFLLSLQDTVKLCDFRSAVYMRSNETLHDDVAWNDFSAPELRAITAAGYSFPADVWSLGATFVAVLSQPSEASHGAAQLKASAFLQSLLCFEPVSRLTAHEAMKHEFFGQAALVEKNKDDADWILEIEGGCHTEMDSN